MNFTTSLENSQPSKQTQIPKLKKAFERFLGFVNYYRKYNLRITAKLNSFCKLLEAEITVKITSDLKETFDSLNNALSDACELALNRWGNHSY